MDSGSTGSLGGRREDAGTARNESRRIERSGNERVKEGAGSTGLDGRCIVAADDD
jgi:hypothetical protein